MTVLAMVMAYAADPSPAPVDTGGGDSVGGLPLSQWFNFAQFGLLGLIFVFLVAKKFIVPEWTLRAQQEAHEREIKVKDEVITNLRQDNTELKATVTELQDLTRERMIPALVKANELSAAYVTELSRRASMPINPGAIGD